MRGTGRRPVAARGPVPADRRAAATRPRAGSGVARGNGRRRPCGCHGDTVMSAGRRHRIRGDRRDGAAPPPWRTDAAVPAVPEERRVPGPLPHAGPRARDGTPLRGPTTAFRAPPLLRCRTAAITPRPVPPDPVPAGSGAAARPSAFLRRANVDGARCRRRDPQPRGGRRGEGAAEGAGRRASRSLHRGGSRHRVRWRRRRAGDLAQRGAAAEIPAARGWVAERFKAAVLKTAGRATAPWVRIPPHPPEARLPPPPAAA